MTRPRLVIGTNRWRTHLSAELRTRLVEERCWLDTAEVYGLGRSERAVSQLGPDIPVATKVMPWWWRPPENLPKYAAHSRKRLKRDILDLLLLHFPARRRPRAWLQALAHEVRDGGARTIGLSEFNLPQLREAIRVLKAEGVAPRVLQTEVSPWHPHALRSRLIPFCASIGIEVWGFRVLGGGKLFGQPRTAHQARVQKALAAVCTRTGLSPVSVVFAWLQHHQVVPMLGVHTVTHLEQALAARGADLPEHERSFFDAAVFG